MMKTCTYKMSTSEIKLMKLIEERRTKEITVNIINNAFAPSNKINITKINKRIDLCMRRATKTF